jgi:hypothetical protein
MKIEHKSDHTKRRAEDYPPVAEQLDMLWHAMNDGTLPKVPDFFEALKKVKEQYPK